MCPQVDGHEDNLAARPRRRHVRLSADIYLEGVNLRLQPAPKLVIARAPSRGMRAARSRCSMADSGSVAASGRLEGARREHALAVFREWLERTDDATEAARRAGVSERTGRRWRAMLDAAAGAADLTSAGEEAPLAEGAAGRGSFVGRAEALTALHRAVRQGQRDGRKIFALTGLGGIGKTRTALRYAELFGRAHFPGGVAVAQLAGAERRDDVAQRVARALGLEADSGQSIEAALAERPACLLVLDDLDGCAAAAAPAIARWAAAAPAATLLATARVRPGIGGETLFELGAMPVEPDGVELFLERARALRPAFAPTPAERAQIGEVVQRLDGLPLAIELAAARFALLGLAELRLRLEAPLELLTGSPGRASLRASLERSWQVLSPPARRALVECTVFRGGFSLAAAERVLTGDATASVVDRLQTLRDHSLLRVAEQAGQGPRFDLYESVRELAAGKWSEVSEGAGGAGGAGGEALRRAVAARHTRAFLELEPTSADLANLRAVHERALALAAPGEALPPEPVALALRALLAMHPLLARTGPLDEYRRALDETLHHAEAAALDPSLRSRAWAARSRIARASGASDEAEADAERALALARQAGDRSAEAQVHRDRGRVAASRGDLAGALPHYEEAARWFAASGDRRGEAHVLSLLSDVANHQGRDADAVRLGERAIALFLSLGDDDSLARARYVEGGLHFRAGRHDAVRRSWEEAIERFARLGDPRFEGYAHTNLGIVCYEIGRYHSARLHLEAAQQRFARAGYQRLALVVTGYFGTLALRLGRPAEAEQRYREAIEGRGGAIGRAYAASFRAARASALALAGRGDEAAAELALAAALAAEVGDPKASAALELHRHVVALAAAPTSPSPRAAAAAALAALAAPSLISDDVRLARDLLARLLDAAPVPPAAAPEAWWICEDGTAFRGPSAPLVDLRARRPLARLLAALAQLHSDAPGAALSAEALFDRAWPGERALPAARQNRVNVALVTLRKLGLRPLLLRSASGYHLDPRSPIELAPPR